MAHFHGSFVALVTPFDAKGRIDRKRLEQIVEWQIQEGTEGIVCCGATGESCSMREADRKKVAEICLGVAQKRIPIVLGTGTSDTRESVRLTTLAQKWGVDGCLAVTPSYNKPSQRGCVLHFQAIANVGLPTIIYNNPARTVIQLQPETIAEIALLPNVVGLKESTADPLFVRRIRAVSQIPILSGEDGLTYEMLREGAVGAISVVGNLVPSIWKKMIALARSGKWDQAKGISDRLQPLCQALFFESNPQPVKYMLSLMGKCKARCRLPLVEPSDAVKEKLRKVLISLNLPIYKPEFSKI